MQHDVSLQTEASAEPVARRRERLLRAVARASRALLTSGPPGPAVERALGEVGTALQADRLLVFGCSQTSAGSSGTPPSGARPLYCWENAALGSAVLKEEGIGEEPRWAEAAGWREQLEAGRPVVVQADEASEGKEARLMGHSADSLLLLPIEVEGQCQGVMRAEARRQPVPWSADIEAEALRPFAAGLGGALARSAEAALETPAGASSEGASSKTPSSERFPQHPASPLHAQILSQVEEAIVAVDEHERITLVNAAAEQLFQTKAEHLLGQSVTEHFSRVVSGVEVNAVRRSLRREGTWSTEATIVDQHERQRELAITLALLQPGDESAGVVALIQDVTEERRRQARLEHRTRMDRALVDVSQMLVSTEDFRAEDLLQTVGKAMQADYVYLVVVLPEHRAFWKKAEATGQGGTVPIPPRAFLDAAGGGAPARLDTYSLYEWRAADSDEPLASAASGDAASGDGAAGDLSAFAVPVLASGDLLYGYLGVEYDAEAPPWIDENARGLNVLGDLLAAYLERKVAATALSESEERYRLFIEAISEGIWCVEMETPIALDQSASEQLQALRERAVVVEFNESMARALQADPPREVIGKKAADVVPEVFEDEFLRDLVNHEYRLHSREYTVRRAEKSDRHFVANVIGTIEEGHLLRLWGSWTNVTDRVLLEQRMVTALEQQQQRMGRELHDGVGQLLTGVRMLSQNIAERHFAEGEPGYDQIQRVLRFTEEAAQLARELQRGMAPMGVLEGGLPQALAQMAHDIDQLPDVACTCACDQEITVQDTEVRLQLYRIAQEAANNALKHAQPTFIQVALTRRSGDLLLQVSDDGCGFDPDQNTSSSLGLHSMRYRARSIGAVLTIDSERGEGTTMRCLLPAGAR